MNNEFFDAQRAICRSLDVARDANDAGHNNMVRRGRGEYNNLQLALSQVFTEREEAFFDMLIRENKQHAAYTFLKLKKETCKKQPIVSAH